MSVIAVLIVCSMIVAGGFLIAFLWAVKHGQFDDRYTPSLRILFDDEPSGSKRDATKNTYHKP